MLGSRWVDGQVREGSGRAIGTSRINAAAPAPANAEKARLLLALALIRRQHEQLIGKCALRFAEINAVLGNIDRFFVPVPVKSHPG